MNEAAERDFKSYAALVFRGDLTLIGKINGLEELERRYPEHGFGALAAVMRIQSIMSPEERDHLMWDAISELKARARREGRQ